MNLLDTVLESLQGGGQLGKGLGLDASTTRSVLTQLMPALSRGVQNNTRSPDGVSALTRALQTGGHQRYLDDPRAIEGRDAIDDGNGILGHILGSKDASRNVAAHAAAQTGVDAGTIKKMLPLVATLVMGGLSKQTGAGERLTEDAGTGLLGSLFGGVDAAGNRFVGSVRVYFLFSHRLTAHAMTLGELGIRFR